MQIRPFVAVCGYRVRQIVCKQKSNGRDLKGAFDDEGDPEYLRMLVPIVSTYLQG